MKASKSSADETASSTSCDEIGRLNETAVMRRREVNREVSKAHIVGIFGIGGPRPLATRVDAAKKEPDIVVGDRPY